MKLLPKWVLTGTRPAIYDCESATAIEQTAKIYGAMNELIAEYNAFVDITNTKITEFENGVKKDHDEFETALRQEFQDFMDAIDLKISEIEQSVNNDIANLSEETSKNLNSAINSLRTELTTNLNNAVTTINETIETLTNRVSTNEGNIETNSNDISSLKTRVSTNEGNIGSNASEISSLKTRVSTNEKNIGTNGSEISSLKTRVSTSEGDISSLYTRVSTNETNIGTNASDITSLKNTRLTKDNIVAGDNIIVTRDGNNVIISGENEESGDVYSELVNRTDLAITPTKSETGDSLTPYKFVYDISSVVTIDMVNAVKNKTDIVVTWCNVADHTLTAAKVNKLKLSFFNPTSMGVISYNFAGLYQGATTPPYIVIIEFILSTYSGVSKLCLYTNKEAVDNMVTFKIEYK